MKKNIQLGKSLGKKEQKAITGGLASCTYTVNCPDKTSSASCTSATGDCSYVYLGDTKVGVKCDGKEFKCNDGHPKANDTSLDALALL